MMWDGMGLFGFGGIGMILFWVLFITIVVLAVRSITGSGTTDSNSLTTAVQTPLEILQTRYAKGEISKEEYEEARQTL